MDWAKPPLRTFYASPAGLGSGESRTSAKAFDSLLPMLKAGDRVILLEGTYPSTRISLKGTRPHPIQIEAEHPAVNASDLEAPITGKALFRNSQLEILDSSYLRIHGLAFEVDQAEAGNGITVMRSHHLAFTQNYFHQQSNYGLLLTGDEVGEVEQVLVERNLFRNMLRDSESGGIGGVRMDYGLRVHGTRTLLVRDNLFDGYFNHSLSLKEKVLDVSIQRNRFQVCGQACIDGGQEPDTVAGTRSTDRTVSNVVVEDNDFTGQQDGTVGIFARNIERIFVLGNRFTGISEPLRVANWDRNSRSCERQLYLIGRKLRTCEAGSQLALIGRPTVGVLFERNTIAGDAQIVLAGRGYADDFLAIRQSSTTGRVMICRRPFIVNGADFNAWVPGLPDWSDAPKLYYDSTGDFVVQDGNCTGKYLTHDCEADRSCARRNQ
ncbi:right-handed parallel beta-helix repeat-containing protein [Geminicoccus flavidas]|uniref:right-handed parallel beta-helix repeat-containing protein n=1 Tax=Geminicoccus flavidas TaxID=2506407 RepID=UPI00135B3EB5|nr:right-handed parallel beta-helix repeat-containing protein [Geminicoccus flavidas]